MSGLHEVFADWIVERNPTESRDDWLNVSDWVVAAFKAKPEAVLAELPVEALVEELKCRGALAEEECCASCGGLIKRVGSVVVCRGTYCYGPLSPKVKHRFVTPWLVLPAEREPS